MMVISRQKLLILNDSFRLDKHYPPVCQSRGGMDETRDGCATPNSYCMSYLGRTETRATLDHDIEAISR
jgi:hypothetical protein